MILEIKKEVYTFLKENKLIDTKNYTKTEFSYFILELLEKEIEKLKN
jgi:hypothetical protein